MTDKTKANHTECDSCIDTVKTDLEKIDGIKSISYNKNEFRITIKGDATTKASTELDSPEKE